MTPEHLEFWLQLLSAFGIGGVVTAIVVAYFLRSFIPAYLGKKAENLATREDIAAITREVEAVRSEYSVLIEELKARHQLRLAALDDRLRAHQQAFTLWRRLNRAAHDGDDSLLLMRIAECQKWWDENCLYLGAETREAFANAFWSAGYLRPQQRGKFGPEHEIKAWEQVSRVGELLVAAVQLPSLGDKEVKDAPSSDA